MVPVLNRVGTHCAVLGNHDFGKKKTSTFYINDLSIMDFVCRSWPGGTH